MTWIFPRFTFTSKGTSNSNSAGRHSKGGSFALSTIGGGKRGGLGSKSYAEIEGGKNDNESEEYILNEDGRVIRQTITTTISSETLRKDEVV